MILGKKIIASVSIFFLLIPYSGIAQTIVVDPDTFEIKIIDDNTQPSIEETQQPEQEEVVAPTPIEEVEQFVPTATVKTTTIKSPSISEFEEALAWMYANQMTIFDNADSYEPFNQLNRGQFAKMINRFSEVVGFDRSTINTKCDFIDQGEADPTLLPHIIETCRIGIFKGYQDYTFRPKKKLTKAEALAVMLRVYNKGRLDESTNPRRQAYYNQAKQLGVTSEENQDNIEQIINRYLIALYLYRLHQNIDAPQQPEDVVVEEPEEEAITNNQYPAIVDLSKKGETIQTISIKSESQDITLIYDEATQSYKLQ